MGSAAGLDGIIDAPLLIEGFREPEILLWVVLLDLDGPFVQGDGSIKFTFSGEIPSVSFHQVDVPDIQSIGLNTNVPMAPGIPFAPTEGESSALAMFADIKIRKLRARSDQNERPIGYLFSIFH